MKKVFRKAINLKFLSLPFAPPDTNLKLPIKKKRRRPLIKNLKSFSRLKRKPYKLRQSKNFWRTPNAESYLSPKPSFKYHPTRRRPHRAASFVLSRRYKKRNRAAVSLYASLVFKRLISRGSRFFAYTVFKQFSVLAKRRYRINSAKSLNRALRLLLPSVQLRSVKRSGTTNLLPFVFSSSRRPVSLAASWFVKSALERTLLARGKRFRSRTKIRSAALRLYTELVETLQLKGSYAKRVAWHKLALKNSSLHRFARRSRFFRQWYLRHSLFKRSFIFDRTVGHSSLRILLVFSMWKWKARVILSMYLRKLHSRVRRFRLLYFFSRVVSFCNFSKHAQVYFLSIENLQILLFVRLLKKIRFFFTVYNNKTHLQNRTYNFKRLLFLRFLQLYSCKKRSFRSKLNLLRRRLLTFKRYIRLFVKQYANATSGKNSRLSKHDQQKLLTQRNINGAKFKGVQLNRLIYKLLLDNNTAEAHELDSLFLSLYPNWLTSAQVAMLSLRAQKNRFSWFSTSDSFKYFKYANLRSISWLTLYKVRNRLRYVRFFLNLQRSLYKLSASSTLRLRKYLKNFKHHAYTFYSSLKKRRSDIFKLRSRRVKRHFSFLNQKLKLGFLSSSRTTTFQYRARFYLAKMRRKYGQYAVLFEQPFFRQYLFGCFNALIGLRYFKASEILESYFSAEWPDNIRRSSFFDMLKLDIFKLAEQFKDYRVRDDLAIRLERTEALSDSNMQDRRLELTQSHQRRLFKDSRRLSSKFFPGYWPYLRHIGRLKHAELSSSFIRAANIQALSDAFTRKHNLYFPRNSGKSAFIMSPIPYDELAIRVLKGLRKQRKVNSKLNTHFIELLPMLFQQYTYAFRDLRGSKRYQLSPAAQFYFKSLDRYLKDKGKRNLKN